MTTDNDAELAEQDALAEFLVGELGSDVAGASLTVRRHDGGHSNETLFVDVAERELVVRRPPPGETADSGHDVLREARIMRALADADVPVPSVVATCDDESVLGCDFFVMERVDGVVAGGNEPPGFADPSARRAVGERMVDTLVDIHAVDIESVGLSDIGRPDGYLSRQVDIFRTQLSEWLLPVTTEQRPVPGVEEVGTWLASNVPEESDGGLVHGDYKLDNLMFDTPGAPSIVGVFDWEMSTLGDPLTDLGWMLFFWHDTDGPFSGIPAEIAPTFTAREGYPTRREFVDRYEERTGREYSNDRFYRALAAFKLATAFEAMYLRHLSGESSDPMYPELETSVPALVTKAKRIIDGERPL